MEQNGYHMVKNADRSDDVESELRPYSLMMMVAELIKVVASLRMKRTS